MNYYTPLNIFPILELQMYDFYFIKNKNQQTNERNDGWSEESIHHRILNELLYKNVTHR